MFHIYTLRGDDWLKNAASLAKLIVHAPDRMSAISSLDSARVVVGTATTRAGSGHNCSDGRNGGERLGAPRVVRCGHDSPSDSTNDRRRTGMD